MPNAIIHQCPLSGIKIVEYPKESVFDAVSCNGNGALYSSQYLRVHHLYHPTLFLRFTTGGSTDFSVSWSACQEPFGPIIREFLCRNGLTSGGGMVSDLINLEAATILFGKMFGGWGRVKIADSSGVALAGIIGTIQGVVK